jgi:hypothetical protein
MQDAHEEDASAAEDLARRVMQESLALWQSRSMQII